MYVYGATGPDNYDCSGLTMRAWGAAGVTIPRTSQAQAGIGTPVSRANVQAGDLIIYYPGSNSHVAIAIDNTRAVHASTEGQPVKIANIDDIGPISTIRHIG
jgi:cell wall-associated NlpC family hydrolase